jgi:hypothetical protein
MGIHLFHYTHGNEHTGIHDVVRDTFATIMQDDGFHWDEKIACASFNHIQLLSLSSQHYVHQKWHPHPS